MYARLEFPLVERPGIHSVLVFIYDNGLYAERTFFPDIPYSPN